MSKITGGTVSIEDGLKAREEYAPPRKVRVELHFEVPEGDEPEIVLSQASGLANAQVKRLLGQKAAEEAKPVKEEKVQPAPEPKSEVAVPATDKELHAAATRKNEEIKNPKAIRELVASFNSDPAKPFTMQQIPADRRKEFLDKLAALKAS